MAPSAPRLCVSLPVHEQPAVVLDQVENLRSFLGAQTQVVLHLSASMALDPAQLAPLLPDGVHVNPRSHVTQWGDIAHLHLDNLRFAYDHLEPFDHVVLHASNDLYVRPGAPERVAATQAGYRLMPFAADTGWAQAGPAYRDPHLAAIVAGLGGDGQLYGGQVEGTFYAADLFAEMLERIARHYTGPRPGDEVYNREEVYFHTLAEHLRTGERGAHLVYADVLTRGPAVSPGTIYALLDGTLAGGYVMDDPYAVKRVPRELHHPNRDLIRALSRANGPRLAPPRSFEAKSFVALALAADVLTDTTLIPAWHATFGAADDATLALLLLEDQEWTLPSLVDALDAGGTGAPDSADVVLVTARGGSFEEASLRYTAHAMLRPAGLLAPPLFDDLPVLSPDRASELPYLARARAGRALRTA
ncbi:MAG: hypothetical protein JWQ18_1581 [Conexibacter sp.]|nr:hypothetical protein [Conexibacter sp.]